MAGFTNSKNGFWAFIDIDEGDYVSFLYGARIKNLYRVKKKVAYKNARDLPPWNPIRFRSGQEYYFPFRLYLEPKLYLDESMVKPQMAYVAENLLLRGGYRKTHFQTDKLTLYNVSNMGEPAEAGIHKPIYHKGETFEPTIVFKKNMQKIPERYLFNELILQSILKKSLRKILPEILMRLGWNENAENFEILGEKALPEGFIDIFIKPKHPVGPGKYMLVEVKKDRANEKDLNQLLNYLLEFRGLPVAGILVAKTFSRKSVSRIKELHHNIIPVSYSLRVSLDKEYSYHELLEDITLKLNI